MTVDIKKLQETLESLHEVEIDNSIETVKKSNRFKLKALKLFRDVEKTEADWEAVKFLLVHPFSMVRVWIAIQFLNAGRKEGWNVLLQDALPGKMYREGTSEDQMRDFHAKMDGYMYMLLKFDYLASLDLSPSIEEMEARWIAEGRMTMPFPRLP